ncbi:CoA transferase, partial [Escherichia coli]|uniref:CoA transferase n=3 Tax=Escherichia coli TaxID=562 RepID=UPI0005399328
MTNNESKGPFEGLLVIDMTHVLNGPFGTQLLCNMGARVIKVEPPGHGDDTRTFGPWICPYISRHLLSLNPLLACCRRYSRG